MSLALHILAGTVAGLLSGLLSVLLAGRARKAGVRLFFGLWALSMGLRFIFIVACAYALWLYQFRHPAAFLLALALAQTGAQLVKTRGGTAHVV